MASILGEAILKIGADPRAYNRTMGGLKNSAMGYGRSISRSFVSGMTSGLAALGVGAGIGGILFGSIKKAMNAQESENLVKESFGPMLKAAEEWSKGLRKELGLNEYEVRQFAATFNVMLGSMGLAEQKAFDMSKGLTQLAYDMASFYNLDPAEAFQKLQSGISGEAEPLKRLGILVNETTVKAYALANGIGTVTGGIEGNARALVLASKEYEQNKQKILASKKSANEKQIAVEKLTFAYEKNIEKLKDTKTELSENDKVLARYGLIMQSTAKAQGDMARTKGSLTNQIRIFKSQIDQSMITLGTKFIPMVTEVVGKFTKWMDLNADKYITSIGNGFDWVVQHKDGLWMTAKAVMGIALALKAVTAAWTLTQAISGLAGVGISLAGGAAAGAAGKAIAKGAGGAVAGGAAGAALSTIIGTCLAVLGTAAVGAAIGTLINKYAIKPFKDNTWGSPTADDVTPTSPEQKAAFRAKLDAEKAAQERAVARANEAPQEKSMGLIDRANARGMSLEEYMRVRNGGRDAYKRLPKWKRAQYDQIAKAEAEEKKNNPLFAESIARQDAYRLNFSAGRIKPLADKNLEASQTKLDRLRAYAKSAPMNQFNNFSYAELAKREAMVSGIKSRTPIRNEEEFAKISRMGMSGRMDAMSRLSPDQRAAYRLYSLQQQDPSQQVALLGGKYGRQLGISEEQRRGMYARAQGLQYHKQQAGAAIGAYKTQQSQNVTNNTTTVNIDKIEVKASDADEEKKFEAMMTRYQNKNLN
jgi:hypothetical protein